MKARRQEGKREHKKWIKLHHSILSQESNPATTLPLFLILSPRWLVVLDNSSMSRGPVVRPIDEEWWSDRNTSTIIWLERCLDSTTVISLATFFPSLKLLLLRTSRCYCLIKTTSTKYQVQCLVTDHEVILNLIHPHSKSMIYLNVTNYWTPSHRRPHVAGKIQSWNRSF